MVVHVSIHADDVYDLVCRMTEGPLTGEASVTYMPQKVLFSRLITDYEQHIFVAE